MEGGMLSAIVSNFRFHQHGESSPLYGEITQSGITLSAAISLSSVICVLFFQIGFEVVIATPALAQTTFIDVQATVGINFTHVLDYTCSSPPIGSGSAWADYDNDGDIDLYITNHGGQSRLYRNEGDTSGDGLPDFIDVAPDLGVDEADQVSHGVVFVDYDNDGDQDLYITHWGGNTLYQNRLMETGDVEFVDVTAIAGVGDADRCITPAWADYDQDGWLDLYLAKHFDCFPNTRESRDALFKNNGDGTFTNVSQYLCADGSLTCDQLNLSLAFSASWFDYDNDGDPDLYLTNDIVAASYPNILWRNDGPDGAGGWTFTDVSAESGTDYSINCKGLGIGDYDNDGWLDMAFGHARGGFLMRNMGDGTFEDVSVEAGVRREYTPLGDVAIVWGAPFFDYDNDQWLDLYYVCGMINTLPMPQPNALFRNDHDGTFTDISVQAGADDDRRGRNASICDFNQDGFLDIFVGNFGVPIILYYNQSPTQGNTNHWLTITAQGGFTVNRDAIGTRFSLTTSDGITQMREIISGQTHGGGDYKAAYFGMGENTSGTLVVRWTDGEVDTLGTVGADQHLHISRLTGVSEQDPIPSQYKLWQNFPNPFNPSTTIQYSVPRTSRINLRVYDLLGREVSTLVNDVKQPGVYKTVWDTQDMASGVYFLRIRSGYFTDTKKLTLMR